MGQKSLPIAGGRRGEQFGYANFGKVGPGGKTPNSASIGFLTLTKLLQLPFLLFVIMYLKHLPRFHTLIH